MSQGGLWIRGPDTVWVAEDHVIALATFLRGVARSCEDSAARLSGLGAPTVDSWAAVDWSVVVRLCAEIRDLGLRAQQIARALGEYAAESAAQERARTRAFEAPRDRAFAVMLVSLGGTQPQDPLDQWGVSHAGQAVLGARYHPGPVALERVEWGESRVHQAGGVAQRVERIPPSHTPIRVERYPDGDGSFSTEVFIAGTGDWGVGFGSNPFDLESNIALVAGLPAVSLLAVELALKRSGVHPGDRVTFVGHSQGGLIAARLAESGRYATTGLITVGAPLGSAPIRGSYPAVSLAHSDDRVPGLGGHAQATRSVGVEAHSGARAGDALGAHSVRRYIDTAALVDSSPAREVFAGFDTKPGAAATPEYFRASRGPRG